MYGIHEGKENPVEYLWESLDDGHFEEGAGHHVPTFAIRIDLTKDQFFSILHFVEDYPFSRYSLTRRQCCSFVQDVAHLAGLELDCAMRMEIQPTVQLGGEVIRLWSNPLFSQIEFPAPEVLEESMKRAVEEGKAVDALEWYLETHPKRASERWQRFCEDLRLFPSRLKRVYQIHSFGY